MPRLQLLSETAPGELTQRRQAVSKMDDFCIKNEEFCIKNDHTATAPAEERTGGSAVDQAAVGGPSPARVTGDVGAGAGVDQGGGGGVGGTPDATEMRRRRLARFT